MNIVATRVWLRCQGKERSWEYSSYHLSKFENVAVTQKEKITEEFLNEHLLAISGRPGFANMANYKAIKSVLEEHTW